MASQPLLLRGGRVLRTGGARPERIDVAIGADGRVERLGQNLQASAGAKIIDLGDRLVSPGLVDCHQHLDKTRTLRDVPNPAGTLLGAVAVASHLSHLPTALALVAFIAFAARGIAPVLHAALPVALAIAGLVGANAWATGRPTLSPHGAVFLLARLQADGPAAETIRAHCPRAGWHLCAFANRLPMESDAFLWDPQSPLNRSAGGRAIEMGGVRLAPEAAAIIAATLREHPREVAEAMIRNTLLQARMFDVGDTLGMRHLAASARRAVARMPLSELEAFDDGAQMRGELPMMVEPLLMPQTPLVVASLGLVLVALLRAARRRDRAVSGLLVGLLVAVAVNAFATGALSAPVHRYQARIVWLLPLAAALGLAPRFGIRLTDAEQVRARMATWQISSSSSPSS